jgi:hypothetical protein
VHARRPVQRRLARSSPRAIRHFRVPPLASGYLRQVRGLGFWLAGLPVGGLFIGLGVVSLAHEPVFSVSCFIGAAFLFFPHTVRLVVDRAGALTGLKRRVSMMILGTFGLVLVGGILVAMMTSGNRPPGSP